MSGRTRNRPTPTSPAPVSAETEPSPDVVEVPTPEPDVVDVQTADDEALDAAPETDAPLPGVQHIELEVSVTMPALSSLVYEGTAVRDVEIETGRLTLYPGALLTLPVVGQVKKLVDQGVLRRLGAA